MVAGTVSPAFDHLSPGTPETVWADSPKLHTAVTLQLAATGRLVVVAAHPDDETLGAGGLLAMASRLEIPTVVLIATWGERSHPESPTHGQAQLKRLRRAEVLSALGILAPTATVRMLGLPDGELTAHELELTSVIAEFVTGASTLVAAPWVADGHPDHAAAGRAAAAAAAQRHAALLEYPVWAWHWGTPDDLPDTLLRLDLGGAESAAKQAALRCHVTQVAPLSDEPGDEAIVGPGFAEHFDRSFEIFISRGRGGSAGVGHQPGSQSLGREFFDEFYGNGDGPDPWGFETRWYERRKRAITMASLPRETFRNAFEPGCSIGVLTAELAGRCQSLLATDISERPLAAARARLAGIPGVRFQQLRIPGDWPSGQFDLVVLSEVGYYCGPDDLRSLAGHASSSLSDDGVLLACHWRHPVGEYPLGGDDVHRALQAEPGLSVLAEHLEEDFVLHVFTRPDAPSVARATGLVR